MLLVDQHLPAVIYYISTFLFCSFSEANRTACGSLPSYPTAPGATRAFASGHLLYHFLRTDQSHYCIFCRPFVNVARVQAGLGGSLVSK